VGLVANGIEARGIPTLVIGTVRDLMVQTRSPRSVFVDFPVGRTFGHPGNPAQHRTVLAAALAQFDAFTEPGRIVDLPLQWAGEDRSWEDVVFEEVTRRKPPPPGLIGGRRTE
jgi:D-proline reductase (dithiol) PrdB